MSNRVGKHKFVLPRNGREKIILLANINLCYQERERGKLVFFIPVCFRNRWMEFFFLVRLGVDNDSSMRFTNAEDTS